MKYKVIIFDCFGVILSNVLTAWFRDNLGDSPKERELLEQYALLQDINKMSEAELIFKISTQVGKTPEAVRSEIDAYLSFDQALVLYIQQLKKEGYKIGLLSNAGYDFFKRKVFVEYPWFEKLFDVIVISSKIGISKPNPEIYMYILKEFSIQPKDAIFVDDSPNNVVAAQVAGIHGILFTSVEQLKKDFSTIDIVVS